MPPVAVTLGDFDVGSWANAARPTSIRVLGWDFSLLLPQIDVTISSTPFSFADYLTANGMTAPTRSDGIRIQYTQSTGRGAYDAGIDNIAFSTGAVSASPLPEPGTWMLLATGLVGVGLAARRRARG